MRVVVACRQVLWVAAMLVMCGSARPQNPYINLGPTADFALDQPFVTFEMQVNGMDLGPSAQFQNFLLDTGASSVVVLDDAAVELHQSSGNFDTGTFLELGVGGFEEYAVSAPYDMVLTGAEDSQITVPNIKVLSKPVNDEFGDSTGFYGIAGMPAMVDRVTTLDFSGGIGSIDPTNIDDLIDFLLNGGSTSSIGVTFGHDVPAEMGNRYSVPVTALHFEPEGEATPTASPLPLLTVTHRLGSQSSTGNYALDTGAQLSIMSLDKLAELGLDVDPAGGDDRFSAIDVQGVGGIRRVPVFLIDDYRVPTNEGVDLVWRDSDPDAASLQVIGLDLDPSLDGVIGSDLLTAGLINISGEIDIDNIWETLFEFGNSPISKVHFDFRELQQTDQSGTGNIYIELNPEHWDGEVVISPPDTGVHADFNNDGQYNCGDLDSLYTAFDSNSLSFDLNGDDSVDDADLTQWLADAGAALGFTGPVMKGDSNLDGVVDVLDLNEVGVNWMRDVISWCEGDFDHNGVVDRIDLNDVGVHWERSVLPAHAANVPEPTGMTLLGFALVLFAMRTRQLGTSLSITLQRLGDV